MLQQVFGLEQQVLWAVCGVVSVSVRFSRHIIDLFVP